MTSEIKKTGTTVYQVDTGRDPDTPMEGTANRGDADECTLHDARLEASFDPFVTGHAMKSQLSAVFAGLGSVPAGYDAITANVVLATGRSTFRRVGGTSGFDLLTAETMRYLASQSYLPWDKNDAVNILQKQGFAAQELGDDGVDSTQAQLYSFRDRAFLVFRGTELTDPDDLDKHLSLLDPDSHLGIPTHSGVAAALDEVWQPLATALARLGDNHEPVKLTIVGHSLGGALASLAALRLHRSGLLENSDVDLTAVYTFAAVNVGGDQFERDYVTAGLDAKTYALFGTEDAFAHFPPESLGFRPVGVQIPIENADHYIDRFEVRVDAGKPKPRGGFRHTIRRAVAVLTRLFEASDDAERLRTEAQLFLEQIEPQLRNLVERELHQHFPKEGWWKDRKPSS